VVDIQAYVKPNRTNTANITISGKTRLTEGWLSTLVKVSAMPMVCQGLKPVPGAAAPSPPGALVRAMLPVGAGAGAETAPELAGTVIMPLFIVAVAVAMVCSL
jgi:hypothetical protein